MVVPSYNGNPFTPIRFSNQKALTLSEMSHTCEANIYHFQVHSQVHQVSCIHTLLYALHLGFAVSVNAELPAALSKGRRLIAYKYNRIRSKRYMLLHSEAFELWQAKCAQNVGQCYPIKAWVRGNTKIFIVNRLINVEVRRRAHKIQLFVYYNYIRTKYISWLSFTHLQYTVLYESSAIYIVVRVLPYSSECITHFVAWCIHIAFNIYMVYELINPN